MRTPPRILVVDDNPTNVDILRTRLAAHGYEVLTASDGEEALAAAREHTPDLVLLDVNDAEARRHRGLPEAQGRVQAATEHLTRTEQVPDLALKGFTRPVPAFDVVALTVDP